MTPLSIGTTREVIEQAGIAALGISAIYRVVVVEIFGLTAEFFEQRSKVKHLRNERAERTNKRRLTK